MHNIVPEFISRRFPGYEYHQVKASEKRSVYRISQKNQPALYVKIYHPEGFFQRIRNLISPRTSKEARIIMDLASSGIKTVQVVECLRHRCFSALVEKAVEPGRILSGYDRAFQTRVMFSLALKLLEKGFIHYDLHSENIIIDENTEPVLIDCYEIRKRQNISERDRIRMLSDAAAVFELSAREIGQLINENDEKRLLKILSRSLKTRHARVERYIKRSLDNSSFSRVFKVPGAKVILRRACSIDVNEIMDIHCNNIKALKDVLKIQEKTQISTVGEYCVKSYKKTRPFNEPYALRSWKGSLLMMFNNFRTAEPLGAIIYDDGSSALITENLKVPQLDHLLHETVSSAKPDINMNSLAASLGETIGNMHNMGLFHADLKACNIFADIPKNELIFIDTDNVRQIRALSKKRRIRNIIQICLSIPRDVPDEARLCFIRSYASRTEDSPDKLLNEIKERIAGSEIVYTTPDGDRYSTY